MCFDLMSASARFSDDEFTDFNAHLPLAEVF